MNAKTIIAAVLISATGLAAAADSAPAAVAAIAAPATAAVAASAAAQTMNLNLPRVSIAASRTRAEVKAEAVDFVAHYQTTLATQLELANNVTRGVSH